MTRILLVEDDADLARGLEFNLRREGYEVLAVSEGRAALAAADGTVDLVILESGRRMTGQMARREVATQLMTITGSPVRLTDPGGNEVSGSSLTWNQADGTVSVAGGTETIYYPEEAP